jgi:hypothetical protein
MSFLISNKYLFFRKLAQAYSSAKCPTPEQYEDMKKKVYDKFPLPEDKKTKLLMQQ